MKRILFVAVILILSATSVRAATITVCPPNGACSYHTIQEGINAAQAGDVVLVAAGWYYGFVTAGADTAAAFMKSGVTLRGSGIGVTVVDCDTTGSPHRPAWRGIVCNGVTNATIENLTVKDAFASIRGCGILFENGSNVALNNCEVRQCLDGGIICYQNSSPTITGCVMANNVNKEGGGLLIDTGCSPVVTGCSITGNAAPGGGGVMVTGASNVTLQNCIISGNSINQATGAGGGVFARASVLTMQDCQVLNNVSSNGGGGVYSTESTLNLTNCSVQGNRTVEADGPGGGILLDYNTNGLVIDCTITRNWIQGPDTYGLFGAGIAYFFAGDVTVRQCTIAHNRTSVGVGSGVSVYGGDPSSLHLSLEKCIIAFNYPGKGIHCVDAYSIPTVSCSDIYWNVGGDGICGSDLGHNFSLNPQFCDAFSGNDYRIAYTSPCAPGQHPEGAGTCDGSRIGGEDASCAPADVDGPPLSSRGGRLLGNLPNPFGPATTIDFEVPRSEPVRLQVFDVAGRLVRTLLNGTVGVGRHQAVWDGRDERGSALPGGIYFCRLSVEGVDQSRPMVLTR